MAIGMSLSSQIKGGRWSPEDDERLRVFHASALSNDDVARQFEARTVAAVKARFRKLKLGARPIARAKWTEQDKATLRKIWFERGTLKVLVAKNLPNRNWRTAMDHGLIVLGLPPRGAQAGRYPFSWASTELDRVLADEPNLAVTEIALRCGVSRSRITALLASGRGKKYFRSGWRNGQKTPLWSLGCEPDVTAEPPLTRTQTSRRWRLKKRVRDGLNDPFAFMCRQIAT